MSRHLPAALTLLIGGCSNGVSVPEPDARAMLLAACESPAAPQCFEVYVPAPAGLPEIGGSAGAGIPPAHMQCPDGGVAVAACPQTGRVGVCDASMDDGIGLLRVHLYPGGEQALAQCENDGSRRAYRL